MNKYEIRTHKKQTAIIEAALELFKENGFTNTSIKQIASSANVSQVSIYNYFGSKDALVSECVKLLSQDTISNARELLDSNMDYQEKLFKGLSLCSGTITMSIRNYFSNTTFTDVNFMHLLNRYIKELENEIFVEFIEAGKEAGAISSTIPTQTILQFFKAFHSIELDSSDFSKNIKNLHQLFLYGIIGK
jgi:AcrR family transcriptional regulator